MNTIPSVDRVALADRAVARGRALPGCRTKGCPGNPWPACGNYCLKCWNSLKPEEKEQIRMSSKMTQQPIEQNTIKQDGPGTSGPPKASNPQETPAKRRSIPDDKIRRVVGESSSYSEAARTLGVTSSAVRQRCQKLSIVPGGDKKAEGLPRPKIDPAKIPTAKTARTKPATTSPPQDPARPFAPTAEGIPAERKLRALVSTASILLGCATPNIRLARELLAEALRKGGE